MQAWFNLQVKLCDPCQSAFETVCVKMRYTNRRILYFTLLYKDRCAFLEKPGGDQNQILLVRTTRQDLEDFRFRSTCERGEIGKGRGREWRCRTLRMSRVALYVIFR